MDPETTMMGRLWQTILLLPLRDWTAQGGPAGVWTSPAQVGGCVRVLGDFSGPGQGWRCPLPTVGSSLQVQPRQTLATPFTCPRTSHPGSSPDHFPGHQFVQSPSPRAYPEQQVLPDSPVLLSNLYLLHRLSDKPLRSAGTGKPRCHPRRGLSPRPSSAGSGATGCGVVCVLPMSPFCLPCH